MTWRAARGLVTLGDLAMFYQAFQSGSGLARTLLENVGQLYSNSLFLGNLFDFLDLRPSVVDPPSPADFPLEICRELRFRNVTFRYPGRERPALDRFNLTSPPAGSPLSSARTAPARARC